MSRARNRLTAAEIKTIKPGKYNDGAGLWLHKRPDGGGQWFLRITVHGRRREMGLGALRDVSLREARIAAEQWRGVARQGKDPITLRELLRRESERNLHHLRDIAMDAFESRKAELKDDGRAGRWFSPLECHVLPKLGAIPVADITQIDIRDTLKPIWHTKADTARKALNRLSICLRHAAALGLDVDLQVTDKAKALLGKTRHRPQHIPAMPWMQVPDFYRSLLDPTMTHLALRMLILTAVRSAPLRHMRFDQIDDGTWTIPSAMMKGRLGATTDFRVPLPQEALQVVEQVRPFARNGFLFSGVRSGVISDMTMSQHMARRELPFRPHGFRSSFRDWLAEATDVPHEIAEACLGHAVGSATERAYRRTDYLDQRRAVMEAWGVFVSGGTRPGDDERQTH